MIPLIQFPSGEIITEDAKFVRVTFSVPKYDNLDQLIENLDEYLNKSKIPHTSINLENDYNKYN